MGKQEVYFTNCQILIQSQTHEYSLSQLRLQKDQNIRDVSQKVNRLSRLSYPELSNDIREKFAVKHLINAIGNKDIMFYVKDKEPRTLDEIVQIVQDNDEFDDKKSNVVKQDDPITNMNNRIENLFSNIDEIKRDKFENRNNSQRKDFNNKFGNNNFIRNNSAIDQRKSSYQQNNRNFSQANTNNFRQNVGSFKKYDEIKSKRTNSKNTLQV
ncbi:hypothetical protein HELRODRAFT_174243 [Helobdella robusta]|uniref:Uncharacterized protein n=1 Tax=Helobdella robusta TaxID=6412 RepID=T1F7V4_HELRO|nr:hypothetical protein HELRODRAFT_174243 [Helobdella robusta]ESO02820.1 hypothetical protein HELRODRAFT_174243 [Helobdella robusta]